MNFLMIFDEIFRGLPGKRRGAGGKAGKLRDERSFGRQDRAAQILSAADKISEKNAQLATVAR